MSTERIETAEQCEKWVERGESTMFLIQVDGAASPALFWSDEDGGWHGTRPVNEEDGPWEELPEESRRTLAVEVASPVPEGFDGDEFTPFTVLWQDSWPTRPVPVDLIAAERRRQVEVEGWTDRHDDTLRGGDLALAASVYASPPERRTFTAHSSTVPAKWPWAPKYWKPCPDDRVRELVKAGALIAAEIDRLLRANEASW